MKKFKYEIRLLKKNDHILTYRMPKLNHSSYFSSLTGMIYILNNLLLAKDYTLAYFLKEDVLC